jgi:small subunit ribosomal protein S1
VSTPETVIDPAVEVPAASNGSSDDLMIEVDGKLVPNYAATIKPFEEGDVVNGEVVRIDKDEVLVDIGYKSEGVIPAHELSIRRSVDPADEVDLGEIVDALVLTKEDQEGRLILSKKRARFEKAWRKIEAAAETGEPVEGSVIEVVKGGLILDLGVRGFLPASLVDIRRVHNLEEFRDQTLECKVIELNRSRNNVVLSRRAVLEEERKEVREQILERLQPGQIVEGKISNIVDFGAFVDLEGIDGLIHISELSWSHVNHPGEVLEIGQDVRVKVLDIDRDRQRISLGLKQTQEDPWQKVLNEYRQGDVLEGKVTKVVAFGAFIEIVPGVEGLVHISELAEHHVETPGEVVTPGEEKWVRILEIDEERRRISLSIKRAETKNNAFSDLIPDELKQSVQDASDEAAAAEAATENGAEGSEAADSPEATEAVTEAATEAPADDVPDLGLSEDVFAEAPVEPAPDEAPPTDDPDEG